MRIVPLCRCLVTACSLAVVRLASAGTHGAVGDLYVASQDLNIVAQFDGESGALVDTFAKKNGLSTPSGLVFLPDGRMLVNIGGSDKGVLEFDSVGNFLSIFSSIATGERDMELGPDGNLYVAEGSYGVRRYSRLTGQLLGTFTVGAELNSAWGIAFGGPNNNLFVTDSDTNRVLEFDGESGQFIRILTTIGGLLASACEMGPNGNLFVGAVVGDVYEIDVTTGVQVRTYDTNTAVIDLTFHPDTGDLFIAEWTHRGNILRYDISDGEFLGIFATGIGHPRGIAFKPSINTTGACCEADELCVEEDVEQCTGIWLGAGSGCDSDPCGALGACCFGSGSCQILAERDCPGAWRGIGSSCETESCVGACCSGDGTCNVTAQDNCQDLWLGLDWACDPNPCDQPATIALYHLDDSVDAWEVQDASGSTNLVQPFNANTEGQSAKPGFGTSVGSWSEFEAAYRTTNFPDLAGENWTIEFFVNTLADTNGDSTPLSFGPDEAWRFRWAPNQDHGLEYRTGNGTVISTGYVVYDDRWHHVALTYVANTNRLTLFWDGTLKGSAVEAVPSTSFLSIGSVFSGNEIFHGLIDEVRVTTGAIYDEDFPIPDEPFIVLVEGACCMLDGSCVQTLAEDCDGQWLGGDTVCEPNFCEMAGACCALDGTCTDVASWGCTGTWYGEGTSCDSQPCEAGPFFCGLGDLPGGDSWSEAWAVSADGRVVVGATSDELGSAQAFRWTPTSGMVGLGCLPDAAQRRSWAKAVSDDGSVIVGWSKSANTSENTTEAFRWSYGEGMVGLGDLPEGAFDSEAWSVDGDGSVIVGRGASPYYGSEAFLWTFDGGMVGLGNLSGDPFFSFARAVSADGETIVGQSDESDSCPAMAFRWTQFDGMTRLGDLPGGACWSIARGVSADGTVIVGSSQSDTGAEAFRWTALNGMVGLGDLPGGDFYAEGWACSADGSLIVGLGRTEATVPDAAFIWDETNGIRDLKSALILEFGLHAANLDGWNLREARSVSSDGQTIVGFGTNPQGINEGWIVYLAGLPIPGDIDGNRVVNSSDFAGFAACLYGPSETYSNGCGASDLDSNGFVDLEDAVWFQQTFTGE